MLCMLGRCVLQSAWGSENSKGSLHLHRLQLASSPRRRLLRVARSPQDEADHSCWEQSREDAPMDAMHQRQERME